MICDYKKHWSHFSQEETLERIQARIAVMWSETFLRSKGKGKNSGKSLQRKKPLVVCKILKMPEIANGKIASVEHTVMLQKWT